MWVPWQDRNDKFAPAIGMHKLDPFYPISVRSFLKESCDLVWLKETTESGPVFEKFNEFPNAHIEQKLTFIQRKEINRPGRMARLDRHEGEVDMQQSARLQREHPEQVYVRGFRHTETGEAYIIYWFFYVENFVPRSLKDEVIDEMLETRPNSWWTHEGDWEGISVHFSNYQSNDPKEIVFSRHTSSTPIPYHQVNMYEGRIFALSALGTHATYNKEVSKKRYAMFAEIARGDRILVPSTHGAANSYKLVELDPNGKHGWLNFRGRWGKGSSDLNPAPRGPLSKRKKHFVMRA